MTSLGPETKFTRDTFKGFGTSQASSSCSHSLESIQTSIYYYLNGQQPVIQRHSLSHRHTRLYLTRSVGPTIFIHVTGSTSSSTIKRTSILVLILLLFVVPFKVLLILVLVLLVLLLYLTL